MSSPEEGKFCSNALAPPLFSGAAEIFVVIIVRFSVIITGKEQIKKERIILMLHLKKPLALLLCFVLLLALAACGKGGSNAAAVTD